MAFTEKDMQAQEEQLSALKDELSRLNQKFDAQLKGMGLTEDDLKMPFHSSFGKKEHYVEQLIWSELGDYVRQLIRKESG